jgi:hypothetical protein
VETARVKKLSVTLALATVPLALLFLGLSTRPSRAQGSYEIAVHKQLGRSDSTIYVGEYLTFTIEIRNDSAFTLTTLPMSDTFNAAVLAYQDAAPCEPDDVGADWLHWDDLTTCIGDLAPGESTVFTVGFIAEHPQSAVVNYAEVHDAQGTLGLLGGATDVVTGSEAVGGSSPVNKEFLIPPGTVLIPPQVGGPLIFTIVITNNGYTTMTTAPLVDYYDPAGLAFNYAEPPPDEVDEVNGVLTWYDVIASRGTGLVPAHGTISVMTVFTALASLDGGVTNGADVSGATDWYGNELAGGSDLVPIDIIEAPAPAPTTTATPSYTSTLTPSPTMTMTPTSISTSAPSATPAQPARTQPAPTPLIATSTPDLTKQATPAFLPESGGASSANSHLLIILFGGLALLALLTRARPNSLIP